MTAGALAPTSERPEPADRADRAISDLADLFPSIAAGLGVAPYEDLLGLDAGGQVCVLLVDGLGANLLREHSELAPYLAGRLDDRPSLQCGFPSTTATSLASLGTGIGPGRHGLLGYEVRLTAPFEVPGLPVLNLLRWDPRVDPLAFQPQATVFERAAAAGVSVTCVLPGKFDGSGLTRAALRGGSFVAADSAAERLGTAVEALNRRQPTLAYVYHGALDHTGHQNGCRSPEWRSELALVDRFAEQLAASLPAGSTLVVTADHGMLDVPLDRRVDVAAEPELLTGVRHLAGEPRARYLHVDPGAAEDVLARWRDRLGPDATVVAREEAISAGWFGPVDPAYLTRIGDIVVVAETDIAIMDSASMAPHVLGLVGMHGARSAAEVLVPLILSRI